jgi:hypothetical protein
MRQTIRRAIAVTALAGAATIAVAAPASAATPTNSTPQGSAGNVTVVGDPGNSNPGDPWTFDPLGIPVIGLIQSVADAPGKLLP